MTYRCRRFDSAARIEVQHRTYSKRYERWKKIQLSPQYSRVKLNAARKLDSTRADLKKQRDRSSKRLKDEIAAIVDLCKPASSIDIDELINRTRAKLDELDIYIANLKLTREEQAEAEQLAKAKAEAEEERAATMASALATSAPAPQPEEMTFQELKDCIQELENRSCELLDLHEENQNRFSNPEFIEDELKDLEEEADVDDPLDKVQEQINQTGQRLNEQGLEIGQALGRIKADRDEQEEAALRRQEKNAQLKAKVNLIFVLAGPMPKRITLQLLAKLAAMDQAALERREKIASLSNQIQNLYNRPKKSYSYTQDLLPHVGRMIGKIIAEDVEPIFAALRASSDTHVRNRQKVIMESVEKALAPILLMTAEVVHRSQSVAIAVEGPSRRP